MIITTIWDKLIERSHWLKTKHVCKNIKRTVKTIMLFIEEAVLNAFILFDKFYLSEICLWISRWNWLIEPSIEQSLIKSVTCPKILRLKNTSSKLFHWHKEKLIPTKGGLSAQKRESTWRLDIRVRIAPITMTCVLLPLWKTFFICNLHVLHFYLLFTL